jgi:NAD(P)-dependent dehydrogenase (short-subunit alcohol dehydrogenase family)
MVHNVTRAEDWEAAVTGTVERLGGLDILVNNAGIEIVDPLLDMTEEAWNQVQEVNSNGIFLGTKKAAEAMIPGGAAGKGGSIINVSSVAGLIGLAGFTAYCTSKGAVRLFSKAAAAEFGRLGIRVNSLHPGLIETEMGRNTVTEMAALGFGGDEAKAEEFLKTAKIPLGCFGNTTDIAAAVVYLASDAARYITGSELVVDGGAVGTL